MEMLKIIGYFSRQIIFMTGVLILLSLLPVSPGMTTALPGVQTVKITDAVNRTVEIELPLQRIVTINTSSAVILRALGVDMQKTVVGVTTYMRDNPAFWPELKSKPAFKFKELNYERLAELNPQLIILYKNSNLTTDEEKLRALNIKWIYMDCVDLRGIDQDVRELGLLFGKKREAEELIRWYRKYERLISDRISQIKPEKRPTVFHYSFLDSNLFKGVYSTKNRKSSSHPMIETAGGINLGADLPMESLEVSAEWVIENNPDVIIGDVIGKSISGYNAKESAATSNMRAFREKIVDSAILKETSAVKNGRVFLLAQDLKEGPACVIGTAYIAKYLYPDIFHDLEPESIAREYYEKWCHLPYRGVYVYPPIESVADNDASLTKQNRELAVTITDSTGRKIDILQPVTRIAGLHTSSCRELCMLQLEEKVVGVTEYLLNDQGVYPRLIGKTNIGSVYAPNYEAIVEKAPEVLIMGTALTNLQPVIDKLEPLGIKVVALDCQPRKGGSAYERETYYDRELELLGQITGQEKRARAFIQWKTDILDMIQKRTENVKKVRVLGINSVSNILNRDGFTTWAGRRIIELAGAINLASGESAHEISGEWILEQNPDAIIISSYWLEEGLGYNVPDSRRVADTYSKIVRNKVIAATKAFQKGTIYLFGYYGTASGGQTPLGALYLAKRLYPDRFQDVDPEKYHREYFEIWFNIDFQGVWFYP